MMLPHTSNDTSSSVLSAQLLPEDSQSHQSSCKQQENQDHPEQQQIPSIVANIPLEAPSYLSPSIPLVPSNTSSALLISVVAMRDKILLDASDKDNNRKLPLSPPRHILKRLTPASHTSLVTSSSVEKHRQRRQLFKEEKQSRLNRRSVLIAQICRSQKEKDSIRTKIIRSQVKESIRLANIKREAHIEQRRLFARKFVESHKQMCENSTFTDYQSICDTDEDVDTKIDNSNSNSSSSSSVISDEEDSSPSTTLSKSSIEIATKKYFYRHIVQQVRSTKERRALLVITHAVKRYIVYRLAKRLRFSNTLNKLLLAVQPLKGLSFDHELAHDFLRIADCFQLPLPKNLLLLEKSPGMLLYYAFVMVNEHDVNKKLDLPGYEMPLHSSTDYSKAVNGNSPGFDYSDLMKQANIDIEKDQFYGVYNNDDFFNHLTAKLLRLAKNLTKSFKALLVLSSAHKHPLATQSFDISNGLSQLRLKLFRSWKSYVSLFELFYVEHLNRIILTLLRVKNILQAELNLSSFISNNNRNLYTTAYEPAYDNDKTNRKAARTKYESICCLLRTYVQLKKKLNLKTTYNEDLWFTNISHKDRLRNAIAKCEKETAFVNGSNISHETINEGRSNDVPDDDVAEGDRFKANGLHLTLSEDDWKHYKVLTFFDKFDLELLKYSTDETESTDRTAFLTCFSSAMVSKLSDDVENVDKVAGTEKYGIPSILQTGRVVNKKVYKHTYSLANITEEKKKPKFVNFYTSSLNSESLRSRLNKPTFKQIANNFCTEFSQNDKILLFNKSMTSKEDAVYHNLQKYFIVDLNMKAKSFFFDFSLLVRCLNASTENKYKKHLRLLTFQQAALSANRASDGEEHDAHTYEEILDMYKTYTAELEFFTNSKTLLLGYFIKKKFTLLGYFRSMLKFILKSFSVGRLFSDKIKSILRCLANHETELSACCSSENVGLNVNKAMAHVDNSNNDSEESEDDSNDDDDDVMVFGHEDNYTKGITLSELQSCHSILNLLVKKLYDVWADLMTFCETTMLIQTEHDKATSEGNDQWLLHKEAKRFSLLIQRGDITNLFSEIRAAKLFVSSFSNVQFKFANLYNYQSRWTSQIRFGKLENYENYYHLRARLSPSKKEPFPYLDVPKISPHDVKNLALYFLMRKVILSDATNKSGHLPFMFGLTEPQALDLMKRCRALVLGSAIINVVYLYCRSNMTSYDKAPIQWLSIGNAVYVYLIKHSELVYQKKISVELLTEEISREILSRILKCDSRMAEELFDSVENLVLCQLKDCGLTNAQSVSNSIQHILTKKLFKVLQTFDFDVQQNQRLLECNDKIIRICKRESLRQVQSILASNFPFLQVQAKELLLDFMRFICVDWMIHHEHYESLSNPRFIEHL